MKSNLKVLLRHSLFFLTLVTLRCKKAIRNPDRRPISGVNQTAPTAKTVADNGSCDIEQIGLDANIMPPPEIADRKIAEDDEPVKHTNYMPSSIPEIVKAASVENNATSTSENSVEGNTTEDEQATATTNTTKPNTYTQMFTDGLRNAGVKVWQFFTKNKNENKHEDEAYLTEDEDDNPAHNPYLTEDED